MRSSAGPAAKPEFVCCVVLMAKLLAEASYEAKNISVVGFF